MTSDLRPQPAPPAAASPGDAYRKSCLIVDDEASLRQVLRRVLEQQGFSCREAASGTEALARLEEQSVCVVLSDYHMPGMDGMELLKTVVERWPKTAVVMVTAVSDVELAVQCLADGAMDYVTKPFRVEEIRGRVGQAIDKRRLLNENEDYRVHLEQHGRQLEAKVRQKTAAHRELSLASVQALAAALEVKDPYTSGHSARVRDYALAIARELSVSVSLLEELDVGARLHDIGKIGVREAILNKPGPLTTEEYDHIMEHPVIGWRILEPMLRDRPHALAVVRSHHERFDGKGVPDQLVGNQIPIEARITAVADSFDAMTSGRPYRAGLPVADAVAELERCASSQFDPLCVSAFTRALARGAFPLPDARVRRATASSLRMADLARHD